MDVFELNEAFAAQSLAVVKELGIDSEKVCIFLISTTFLINFSDFFAVYITVWCLPIKISQRGKFF